MRRALTLILFLVSLIATAKVPTDKPTPARAHYLQSEKPTFSVLRKGLPSNQCRALLQDSLGYIWIGTTKGITRYDGVNTFSFKTTSASDTFQLASRILSLSEDRHSNAIWASFELRQKLLKIDLKTFETSELPYSVPQDGTLPRGSRFIYGIMSISDSTLLCCSQRLFFTINKNNGNVKIVKRIDPKRNSPRSPFVSVGNQVITTCEGGLYSIRTFTKSDSVDIAPIPVTDDRGKDIPIKDFSVATDSTIIITAYADKATQNICEYNIRSHKLTTITPTPNTSHGIAIADDGIWLPTYRGIIFIRKSDSQIFRYTSGNSTLHDNDLTCILKLRDQPIFLIGSNDGLIMLNYYASKFEHTDLRRFSPSDDAQAWNITKDSRGNYWLGCIDGLFLRSNASLYFKKIDIPAYEEQTSQWVSHIEESKEKDFIIASFVRSIIALRHDGSFLRYIYDMHETKIFSKQRKRRLSITASQPLPGGRLLVVLEDEVLIIDSHNGTTLQKFQIPNKYNIIYGRTDDYKSLWLSCSDWSIRRLDLATGEITDEGKTDASLGHVNYIRHNKQNGIDELWMITVRNSLIYKNPGYKGFRQIDNNSAIPAYTARAVEFDNAGNVWVSTIDQLIQFDGSKTHTFTADRFNVCHKFIMRSANRGPNGEILMGGKFDFVEFSPGHFDTNDYYPAPQLASYILANSLRHEYDEMAGREILYGGGIVDIPAGIRSILLKVRSLNYDNPENNTIQWRLNGDNEWHTVDPSGQINLTHITEGTHTLALRTVNDDGIPQTDRTTIVLNKSVFFYEKRIFYFFIFFVITLAVVTIFVHKNLQTRRIRMKMADEMDTISQMLVTANKEMRNNQAIIKQKNEELANANANLERTVAERTKELESAKEKAEESSQLKSTFLASLGHEVRTPMNAIVGFAKLLQADDCSQEDRTEFAHLILESSNSMLTLMGALLDTSRIERGVMEISLADTDVYREISDTWRMLSVEKKNKAVTFTLNLDDNLKDQILVTDKDRLRQIIINITYNAFKFTPAGSVNLTAKKETIDIIKHLNYPQDRHVQTLSNDILLVSVEDTGIGIPADKQDAIFEPFRRLNANKARFAGLGLGLNIVKSLTQMLGGDVWLKSTLGVGSTFYFFLPFGLKKDK